MLLHGMEKALLGEVVVDVAVRFMHWFVAHGEGQGDLFDGVDVERIAGPLVDQLNAAFKQGTIAVGDATQAAVVQLETVVRRDSVGLQASAQLEVVRTFTDGAPVVLEAVHHVLAGANVLEHPLGVFEEQGVGVDEQGLVRQGQAVGNGAGLAPVVIAVGALPGGHDLIAQGDGFDGPAGVVLRAIGQDPDAQRLGLF